MRLPMSEMAREKLRSSRAGHPHEHRNCTRFPLRRSPASNEMPPLFSLRCVRN
jgi:hypothetical protein